MRKLADIRSEKARRHKKLMNSVELIRSRLIELGAEKIVLFGSLARNEIDVASDLDLLVVMPPGRSGKEWMGLIYEQVDRRLASDIIAYNRDEWEQELPVSRFLKNALASGRIIYEKNSSE